MENNQDDINQDEPNISKDIIHDYLHEEQSNIGKTEEDIINEIKGEYNRMLTNFNESSKVQLNIVNTSNNPNPEYSHEGDSGFDLRVIVESGHTHLEPLERKLFHTGIYMDIPDNYEIQVRPRSGMALKQGLGVLNSPGTVDDAYTGEVGIIAINLSNETIQINDGDRIAQAVLMPVMGQRQTKINIVDKITKKSERGADGYGSTGKN